jgi:hypothetical protein
MCVEYRWPDGMECKHDCVFHSDMGTTYYKSVMAYVECFRFLKLSPENGDTCVSPECWYLHNMKLWHRRPTVTSSMLWEPQISRPKMSEDSKLESTVYNTVHMNKMYSVIFIMNGYVVQECKYLGSDTVPINIHLNSLLLVHEDLPRIFRHPE